MTAPTNPGADHERAKRTADEALVGFETLEQIGIKVDSDGFELLNLARAYLEKLAEDEKCFSYEAMADMAKQRDEARAQLAAARSALRGAQMLIESDAGKGIPEGAKTLILPAIQAAIGKVKP